MKDFDKENKYLEARERVDELKKFYSSLFSYVIVNIFLAWLNYYTNGWNYMWFLWVIFGWGIGLVFQAIKVFQLNPFMNKDWEKRKIQEFMEEENTDLTRRGHWE